MNQLKSYPHIFELLTKKRKKEAKKEKKHITIIANIFIIN